MLLLLLPSSLAFHFYSADCSSATSSSTDCVNSQNHPIFCDIANAADSGPALSLWNEASSSGAVEYYFSPTQDDTWSSYPIQWTGNSCPGASFTPNASLATTEPFPLCTQAGLSWRRVGGNGSLVDDATNCQVAPSFANSLGPDPSSSGFDLYMAGSGAGPVDYVEWAFSHPVSSGMFVTTSYSFFDDSCMDPAAQGATCDHTHPYGTFDSVCDVPDSGNPRPRIEISAHDTAGEEIGRLEYFTDEPFDTLVFNTTCDDLPVASLRFWHRNDGLAERFSVWFMKVHYGYFTYRMPSLHTSVDALTDPVAVGTDDVEFAVRVFNAGPGDADNVTVLFTFNWTTAVSESDITIFPANRRDEVDFSSLGSTGLYWRLPGTLYENTDDGITIAISTTSLCADEGETVEATAEVAFVFNSAFTEFAQTGGATGGADFPGTHRFDTVCTEPTAVPPQTCSTPDSGSASLSVSATLSLINTMTPTALVAGESDRWHGNLNTTIELRNTGPSCYRPTEDLVIEPGFNGNSLPNLLEMIFYDASRDIQDARRGTAFNGPFEMFQSNVINPEGLKESNAVVTISDEQEVNWVAIAGATFCSSSSSEDVAPGVSTTSTSNSFVTETSDTSDDTDTVWISSAAVPFPARCEAVLLIVVEAPEDATAEGELFACDCPFKSSACCPPTAVSLDAGEAKMYSISVLVAPGNHLHMGITTDCANTGAMVANFSMWRYTCEADVLQKADGSLSATGATYDDDDGEYRISAAQLGDIPAGESIFVNLYTNVGPSTEEGTVVCDATHDAGANGQLAASASAVVTRQLELELVKRVLTGPTAVPGAVDVTPLPNDELDDYTYTSETSTWFANETDTTLATSESSSFSEYSSGVRSSSSASSSIATDSDPTLTDTSTIDTEVRERGGHIIFELEVWNRGPSDATGLVIDFTESLPDGVTFVGADFASHTSFDRDTKEWTIGTLAPYTPVVFYAAYFVDACADDGAFVACAASVQSVNEVNVGDSTASALVTLEREYNLVLSVVDSQDPVGAGCADPSMAYTVLIHNEGPSCVAGDTFSADVVLNLPAFGVALSSVESPSVEAGVFSGFSPVTDNTTAVAGTWTFNSTVELAPRDSFELAVPLEVGINAGGGADAIRLAGVVSTSGTGEDDTSDNAASEGTTVLAAPNLRITNVDSHDPVVAGSPDLVPPALDGNVEHVFTVSHSAAAGAYAMTAREVVVHGVYNHADEGISFDGLSPPSSAVDTVLDGKKFTWSIGDVAPGDEFALHMAFDVDNSAVVCTDCIGSEVSLSAVVPDYCSATTADGVVRPALNLPYDDDAKEFTSVVRHVELELEHTQGVRTVQEEHNGRMVEISELSISAELRNNGPSNAAALAVEIDFELPKEAVVEEIAVSHGMVTTKHPTSAAFGLWVLPLEAGETANLRITVRTYKGGKVIAVVTVDESLSEETITPTDEDDRVVGFTVSRKL